MQFLGWRRICPKNRERSERTTKWTRIIALEGGNELLNADETMWKHEIMIIS